jgi:hypothetical protein
MHGLYLLLKENKQNKLPDPTTDSIGEFNLKPRLVYCNLCKYEIMTSIPGPKCGQCGKYLITVSRRRHNETNKG